MLFGVTRVKTVLTYDVAVEKLRQQIVLGLLLPSERLPPERKLAEDIGVSRVTLREALRVLETQGYLTVTRGSRGGATIADEKSIALLALRQLKNDPTLVYRAMEYWACNAQAAVGFAAERRTPADLKGMRVALADMATAETWPKLRRAQATFFLSLADASANAWIVDGIRNAMATVFLPQGGGARPETRETSLAQYDALYQALLNRDGAAAVESMAGILRERWELLRSAIGGKSQH